MPAPPSSTSPSIRARIALAATGAVALCAYWLGLLAGAGSPFFTHWLYVVVLAVPTALVVIRAVARREERLPWALVAAGLVVWTTGFAYQVLLDLGGGTLGYPSLADALWLLAYPITLVAIVRLAQLRLHRPAVTVALDIQVITLVVTATVAAAILPHVIENDRRLSGLAQAINLAYPLADGLFLAVALTCVVLAGRRGGGLWALLGGAAAALVVADAIWALHAAAGTWNPVIPANALYPLWPAMLAAAAWLPTRPVQRVEAGEADIRVLGAALVAVLGAVALLVANEWVAVPAASVVLAALALLAAINRTGLALTSSLRAWRGDAARRGLVAEVRHALAAGELTLHFQPLVDPAARTVHGAEALLRWRRDGSFIPPDAFLPVVEDGPLMTPLTDFVLDRALGALAGWRARGHDLGVSVNLAAANLSDADLPRRVALLLERHGVPADALTLEMTETAAVKDIEAADRVLGALDALGVELSLDDFGTGHSSLARLARFPIDEVKIDRSFVSELAASERPIVATTIQLAQGLGLRVVAEGVEDAMTLGALRAMGCDLAQGYHLSPPLTASELEAFLGTPLLAAA
jgi:EAL domain-containing protein (putative c-di-GMP-specific phosphodiesterase class I)